MTLRGIIKDHATKFVDVRTSREFSAGHLNGAVNIPLEEFQDRYEEIEGLGKFPVVFYCRSGNRSGQAVAYLHRKGIMKIYNGGGLEDVQFYLN